MKNLKYLDKRINELILLMKSEKDIVDDNYSKDWEKVEEFLFKSKSTIKCLRKHLEFKNKIRIWLIMM